MLEVAVRNVAGFLVQLAPCAVLCFLPFSGSLRRPTAHVYGGVAVTLAVALVPYVAASVWPIDPSLGTLRFLLQDAVFYATLAVLGVIYARGVRSDGIRKAFVFALVMCYGFLVVAGANSLSELAGIVEEDGYMFPPAKLAVLTATTAVFFAPMAALMRFVRRVLQAPIERRTLVHLAALPCVLTAAMLVGGWLPSRVVDADALLNTFTIAVCAAVVFVMWWMLRTVLDVSDAAVKRTQLAAALARHERKQRELENALQAEQQRSAELERAAVRQADDDRGRSALDDADDSGRGTFAGPDDGAKNAAGKVAGADGERSVVLATSTQAVSFLPSDVVYAESLNRVRIVHLAGGESVQIGTTLAQIAAHLPSDRFVYCHRSIVVNLDFALSLDADELTLRGGAKVPVSRRRLPELRDALAARAAVRDRA